MFRIIVKLCFELLLSEGIFLNKDSPIEGPFTIDFQYQPSLVIGHNRFWVCPLLFLCPLGDDLSRGMLQFAKGVPLGEKGLDWLKIHLVALHGTKKKSSLKERLQYANDIMDNILDSADNPLTVGEWLGQHSGKSKFYFLSGTKFLIRSSFVRAATRLYHSCIFLWQMFPAAGKKSKISCWRIITNDWRVVKLKC